MKFRVLGAAGLVGLSAAIVAASGAPAASAVERTVGASDEPRSFVLPLGEGGVGADVTTTGLDDAAYAPEDLYLRDEQSLSAIQWRNSAKLYKQAGATIKAYAAIQKDADSDGCGQFRTSATIDKKPSRIRDKTSWTAYGISPSISVSGVSGGVTDSGTDHPSVTLENNKGQLGAYIDGGICMSFFTMHVGEQVNASTTYAGQNFGTATQIK